MKRFLQLLVFSLASLWFVSFILPGVRFQGGFRTLLTAAFALTLVNLIIKPLVNLLLLPINLLTLGMFRWLVNVITLYLVTLLVPQFRIEGFIFPGINYNGFIIPQTSLNLLGVLILASFLISLVSSFLIWLMD